MLVSLCGVLRPPGWRQQSWRGSQHTVFTRQPIPSIPHGALSRFRPEVWGLRRQRNPEFSGGHSMLPSKCSPVVLQRRFPARTFSRFVFSAKALHPRGASPHTIHNLQPVPPLTPNVLLLRFVLYLSDHPATQHTHTH